MNAITSDYLRSTMERHETMFKAPALKSVGGADAPRTTITEHLVATYAKVLETIRPATIIEIGAHEASFSADIKRRMPAATVIALEANPHVFETYRKARHLAESGVIYDHCAISDSNGDVSFNIPVLVAGVKKPLGNMMGSLGRLGIPGSDHETITVHAKTLDTYLAAYPSRPLAIWIDVEGAVDRVLAGGSSTMQAASVVICEVETAAVWQTQAMAADLLPRFGSFGFVPIARDCQKAFQYNVMFVKQELLNNPDISAAVRDYTTTAESLVRSLSV